MSLFTRRHRIEQLAALGDVIGLRGALLDAATTGGRDDEDLCAAASALVDLGEPGITVLVDAILTDPEHAHFVRIADETFHRAACPRAVDLLSHALVHHEDAKVRVAATGVLRRLDTTLADEAFAAAVTDPDPHVRLSAALGLADHDDARGVRALLEWVAHSDDPVPALAGLTRLGDTDVVPVLEQLYDASRTPYIAHAIRRAIEELEAHPARRPKSIVRLERVRDRLRSIELVDRLETPGGPYAPGEVARARAQIPAICARLDAAVAALRTKGAAGRQVNRTDIGIRLAAFVEEVSGDDFDQLMAVILEPRGVRELRSAVVELDLVASELQERGAPPPRVEG
jgi:hypothetical protein